MYTLTLRYVGQVGKGDYANDYYYYLLLLLLYYTITYQKVLKNNPTDTSTSARTAKIAAKVKLCMNNGKACQSAVLHDRARNISTVRQGAA